MLERVDAALAAFIERVGRGPAASAMPRVAPPIAELCKEEDCAFMGGNDDSIFKRLMAVNDTAEPRRLAAASTFTHGTR